MNKILTMIIMGLLVLSIMPMALAEDSNETTEVDALELEDTNNTNTIEELEEVEVTAEETEVEDEIEETETEEVEIEAEELEEVEEEIKHMATIDGATQRLYQLQLSLENQIAHAKDIVAETEDTELLETRIVELELLLERVKAIEPTGTAADMAAEFVAIKKEAITASQEFRKEIYSKVSEDKINKIKDKIKENKELRKEKALKVLKERRNNIYMEQMTEVLSGVNEDAETLMEEVKSGKITRSEAVEKIRNMVKSLSEEEKEEIKETMEQNRTELNNKINKNKELAKEKFQEKVKEIRANTKEKLIERKAQLANKIKELREDRVKRGN